MPPLTHASNLRKFAKAYMKRKFDAQSAHVTKLRRYCTKHKVAQFRRKIGAIWVVGYLSTSTLETERREGIRGCIHSIDFSLLKRCRQRHLFISTYPILKGV